MPPFRPRRIPSRQSEERVNFENIVSFLLILKRVARDGNNGSRCSESVVVADRLAVTIAAIYHEAITPAAGTVRYSSTL